MFCGALTNVTLGNSVESIGSFAFSDTSITSISIPASLKSIGNYAFDGCSKLSAFIVDPDNTVFQSQQGVLYSKDGSTLIAYPRAKTNEHFTVPDFVITIGENAFARNTYLMRVTISNSVTKIGSYAFERCPYLEKVTLSNTLASIDSSAFSYCSRLESITIPPSLQTVGYSAFYDCTNLKDVYVTDLVSWCKIFFEDSTANPMYYAQNFYLDGELLTELIIPE